MLIGNVNREAERVNAGAALNCLAANQFVFYGSLFYEIIKIK
jgi:hypothetical protein